MSKIETVQAERSKVRTPRKSLVALRVTALVTLASTLAQPVLAGMFLDHDVSALAAHQANAGILHLLQFAQLIAAWLYWQPGGGSSWPLLVTAVLWLLAGAQFAVGEESNLTVHLPLGVAILLFQGGFTVWALRQRRPVPPGRELFSTRPRRSRRRRPAA